VSILDSVKELADALIPRIAKAIDTQELEQLRVEIMGKKGKLTALLRGLGQLAAEERTQAGKAVNQLRDRIEQSLNERRTTLSEAELEKRISAEAVDVTLPGRSFTIGSQHLISRLTEQIVDVFRGIGFKVVTDREVETAYYNFTALNAPPDHPSRSFADTFYIRDRSGDSAAISGESDVLLRTQTSGAQIHAMEERELPLYIISPGRVYRRDTADPSHLPQFTQIEGLAVDKGLTFGDLKGTLDYFCKQIFGADRQTRFRPHFFPFTEPSAEVDVACGICHGEGCRFCGHTGWLEILGCGMVDPNVFGYVDVDPAEYTGFAFGLGVERIAALKYNVSDLRMLVEGDMRFLHQF
jgi:phenylalanyl-tRNA synthetase alpha chain